MRGFRTVGLFCLLGCVWASVLWPAAGAEGPAIYTKETVPAAPTLDDLPLKESVSQYGITWTFETPARVGQFVTGDYYVVGSVTVKTIDPAPLFGGEVPEEQLDAAEQKLPAAARVRNGSMLNPPARKEMAYDSGIRNWFKPEGAARLPIKMNPGDSLVSTISLKQGELVKGPYHSEGQRQHKDDCPLKTAAILTCVAVPQPPDAFRPSYCDRRQRIYLARDLRRELLPNLPHVAGTPEVSKWLPVFQKPWLNTGFFSFDQPMENMPHYEQWICQAFASASLLLCVDLKPGAKERLLQNMVQVGIDYCGVVRGGHPGWEGWGGHGSGRKFAVVFAGLLLGDDEMANVTRNYPQVDFGEDNQTMYGDGWTGAKVVYAGHSGIQRSGKSERPKWGPYEHLPPSKWTRDNLQSEAYRRANTSCAWVGEALFLHLVKAEKQWNHDAFFDYVDRWMFEDDTAFRHEVSKYFPDCREVADDADWAQQGFAGEPFVKEMWNKYRATSAWPTDGWKKGQVPQPRGDGPQKAAE